MRLGRLPLTALRSFEAAGRLLSFTRAAEELRVTQAAISRQVRELEAIVGQPLFERRHRRVDLTEAGRQLLGQLTQSFDAISRSLGVLRSQAGRAALSISVEPSFAGCWLVPRLHRFHSARPDIDVVVKAEARLTEFRGEDVDIAIRYGAVESSWPRTQARRLANVRATPVLSPALLSAGRPLAQPRDLLEATLLHEESRSGWAHWFRTAGLTDVAPPRGPVFTDGALTRQAALLGHGVALADLVLVEQDLAEGRLVRPFDIEIASGAYWLVTPDAGALSEPASAFASWLRDEFAAAFSLARPAP